MLLAMSNLLQVCYRTEVFDSARPLCANGTLNSIGMFSAERQRALLHPLRLGHVGAPSDKSALPGLSCPVQCCAQQKYPLCPRRPAVSPTAAEPEAQLRQPWPWAGGRSIVVGATHLLPETDLADGWEWRQPLPSDRFASAVLSWFVLPWPRVNAESPPSTTPEDPSVRLVWDLPQSVRPQTLLQDNPSLESGRPSLGLSAHSSIPEPPPAAALASPTRRVNLSLPPPV